MPLSQRASKLRSDSAGRALDCTRPSWPTVCLVSSSPACSMSQSIDGWWAGTPPGFAPGAPASKCEPIL
eukprot:13817630-Alexandrium_andersonii.AAC.1